MRCLTVKLIGDQTRQRCDRRSKAAQIHAQQQCICIFCKAGQHHRRRHIADTLRKRCRDPQFPALHHAGKEIPNHIDPCNIAHEHEKADKCPQETVICLGKELFVTEKYQYSSQQKAEPVRKHPEHSQQTRQKQQQIYRRRLFRYGRRSRFHRLSGAGRFRQQERQSQKDQPAQHAGGEHGTEEVCGMQLIRRIEV